MNKEQIFLHHSIYPNASDIFSIEIDSIEDILDKCIFILDTNVLLLPYTTTSSSFNAITEVFSELIKEKRLLIPAQVAREFAKNRPEKIKSLFQQLNITKSKIQKPSTGQYPLLESLPEYIDAIEIEKEIQTIHNKYSKKIDDILNKIKQWRWNDPVSMTYRGLFKPEYIKELELDKDEIIKELEKRNEYNIPPGFKDKAKEDFGVGDLIIWLTILEIAKEKESDIIFISGDEKNDWFYRSENQSLYPRFELISEFRYKTGQKNFHIIKLSQLLTLVGAKEDAVKEIEFREFNTKRKFNDFREFNLFAENVIYKWIQKLDPSLDIIFNKGGFPTFMIKHSDHIEGIEILTTASSHWFHLVRKLKDSFLRAFHEIHKGDINSFRIFIICPNDDFIDNIIKHIEQNLDMYKNEFIQIFPGIITEEGDFIPVV